MKKHIKPAFCGLLAVLWLCAGAQAAPLATEAEQMVVTATLSERKLLDAPGSVEVITSEQIREINALTVADALENALGLVVTRESGRVEVPSIRGARSKHTLILLDGRRLTFGFNDMVDLRQIPTVMVERIEILRGPASALYGSDALGGVVNIITRTPPADWSGEISAQYGINREGEGAERVAGALAGGHWNRFGILLAAELRKKDKWDSDGIVPDDSFEQKPAMAAARLTFDIDDANKLSGGFEYIDNSTEGTQFFVNQDRKRWAEETRRGAYLQYDTRIADTHRLMLRANRSDYSNDIGFLPYEASGERSADYYTNQLEFRYSGLYAGNYLVTAGLDWRREGLKDTQIGVKTDNDVDNSSLFLQNEFNLTDPLSLVLALRYDHHGEFGNRWSPQVSMVYAINESLRLKGSYGQGFRAPSLTELYVTSFRRRGRDIYEPNQDLKPEKSTSYEVGIEGVFDRVTAGLTYFHTDFDQLIETLFDRSTGSGQGRIDYYRYANISDATLKGIEAEAGVDLGYGLSVAGNFTWTDTSVESTGEDVGAHPEYKGFIKLGYQLPRWNIHSNLRASYTGRLKNAAGETFTYTLYSAHIAKKLGNKGEIFAGIDNIFDKQISWDGVERIEPTSYYAGMKVLF